MKVESLTQLGKTVVEVVTKLEAMHAKGNYVVMIGTGLRSDRDLASMLKAELPKLRKGLTERQAKRNGKKGGRPKEDAKRMPIDEARKVWTDMGYATNEAAIAHMPGWTIPTAYRLLKKSGREKFARRTLKKRRRR